MDKSEELNNARIISEELDISVISVNDEEDEEHVVLYDEKDIEDAKRLGMTVEQLFKMLDECNQYEYDDHEDCVEWPYLGLNEYVDEGAEESMY